MARRQIALVGCGNWGRHILRDLQELGCDVTVVARSEATRRRAAEAGAVAIVPGISELPPVDGVVVATPTITHAETVEECLPLRVPVFVEKPLTCDLEAAERIAALAGDRVFTMDKWRYHPGVEALASIARSGELGAVVGLRTARLGWQHNHRDVDAIWILVPHDLAIAVEILGSLPPVHAALAERAGGQVSGLVALLGERPWLTIDASATSLDNRRSVQLLCEHGTCLLTDSYADHIAISQATADGGEPELRPVPTEWPLLRELRAFVEHVGGGPAPRTSAAESVEIVRRLVQLRRAAGVESPAGAVV
jgi:predicted dehydrogenase